MRRECLDRTFFWTAADPERKLLEFQQSLHRIANSPRTGRFKFFEEFGNSAAYQGYSFQVSGAFSF